jgi:hypothetical protein
VELPTTDFEPTPAAFVMNLDDTTIFELKELQDILECPVCFTLPRIVYECCNSHIICGACAEKIYEKKCPSCRVTFSTNKRSRIAEKIIDTLRDFEVTCSYALRGCDHAEKKSKIEKHMVNCGSRPVQCPDVDCKETVNLDQFLVHLQQKHKSSKEDLSGGVMRFCVHDGIFKMTNSSTSTHYFYSFHGQTYIPILWKQDNTFRVMLYILASEEVAKKHKVTISISGKEYSVNYTTTAVPIDTPLSEAKQNEENSLHLANSHAKKCILKSYRGNDVLEFEFKVLKFNSIQLNFKKIVEYLLIINDQIL